MADGEQPDQSQKTEQPTEKRKREARQEGRIPLSKELSAWIVIVAGIVAIFVLGPYWILFLPSCVADHHYRHSCKYGKGRGFRTPGNYACPPGV